MKDPWCAPIIRRYFFSPLLSAPHQPAGRGAGPGSPGPAAAAAKRAGLTEPAAQPPTSGPIMIGLAAPGSSEDGSRCREVRQCGVLARELAVDVRAEDLQARGAARRRPPWHAAGARRVVAGDRLIPLALSSTTGCPAAARPLAQHASSRRRGSRRSPGAVRVKLERQHIDGNIIEGDHNEDLALTVAELAGCATESVSSLLALLKRARPGPAWPSRSSYQSQPHRGWAAVPAPGLARHRGRRPRRSRP